MSDIEEEGICVDIYIRMKDDVPTDTVCYFPYEIGGKAFDG